MTERVADVILAAVYLDTGMRVGLALVPVDGTFRSWCRGVMTTVFWPLVLIGVAGEEQVT